MDTLTAALSGAALLLSIASPIITAVINAHAQRQERESEFYLRRKAEVIENYVRSTSAFLWLKNNDNREKYGAAYGEIMLYVTGDVRNAIQNLNVSIQRGVSADPHEYTMFNAICECLSEDSPRVKNQKGNRITKK